MSCSTIPCNPPAFCIYFEQEANRDELGIARPLRVARKLGKNSTVITDINSLCPDESNKPAVAVVAK